MNSGGASFTGQLGKRQHMTDPREPTRARPATDLDTDDVTDRHAGTGDDGVPPGTSQEDVEESVDAETPPHDADRNDGRSNDQDDDARVALVEAGGRVVDHDPDDPEIEGPNPA